MSAHIRSFVYLSVAVLLSMLPAAAQSHATQTFPAGTDIKVRADQAIKTTTASTSRTYPATVSEDVTDSAGTVIIPRNSRAALAVVPSSDGKEVMLDLRSVSVNG